LKEIEILLPGLVKITPKQDPSTAWETPNIYMVGTDEVVLIDSGYDSAQNHDLLTRAIGNAKLDKILLTHGHIDHAGGAWELRKQTGASVLVHNLDHPPLERRFPGNSVDGELTPGDVITAGEYKLKTFHIPGHTPGHVAFMIEDKEIFFSGDLVTGQGSTLVAPPEGNMARYMESLKMVRKMEMKMILPGHGPVVNGPQKRVNELIEHRELREITIIKCLSQKDMGLKGLVKEMYVGLIHPQMEGPAAWTAWAHLQKLVEENNVVADPENSDNPFEIIFSLSKNAKYPFLK
jgi:glyoxylase-like metal-dependent hydrolase (beta-lactamase superfamily II)